jgi:8-oxo-dGTP diphosphatase
MPHVTQAVVGAAIVRGARVLAARRSAPPELAGGWEFPGGKVEAGEDDHSALVRECREELGVGITVGGLLAETRIRDGLVLRVYLAELRTGVPEALADHDGLRWLTVAELHDVPWLAPDRPAVEALRRVLNRRPSR